MNAMIDVYHNEITAALSAGDNKWLASIAASFCQRCHYYLPWGVVGVRAKVCPLDGLRAEIDIKFADESTAVVTVGYSHGKRRLLLNGERVCCESSADVVHALEVPCAFFDGIYYAIEGLADVARGDLKEQIAKYDHEAKQSREAAEREFGVLRYTHKEVNKLNKKLAVAQERLAKSLEAKRLVGKSRAWTLMPVDFNSRVLDAQSMLAVPVSEFVLPHEARQKLWGKSGVYFGWRVSDGKCVYVGKSENLGSRINPSRDKLADCKITVLEMPAEQIHLWELFFIWLHKPERNKEMIEAAASAAKSQPDSALLELEAANG